MKTGFYDMSGREIEVGDELEYVSNPYYKGKLTVLENKGVSRKYCLFIIKSSSKKKNMDFLLGRVNLNGENFRVKKC